PRISRARTQRHARGRRASPLPAERTRARLGREAPSATVTRCGGRRGPRAELTGRRARRHSRNLPGMVEGWVTTEFEPVLDEFTRNFDERGEVGAAVCAYVDGHPVVDLWGGVADVRTGAPWAEDTIVLVYSSTKGVTSVCLNLAIQRGWL